LETNILNTHRDLVEKSKQGHRQSQYELYNLYVDAMYNVCLRMVRNVEDAEDVTQDSFVDAFTQLASFRYESTFGSWLKRIVINRSINHLKKKRIPVTPLENHEFHLGEEEPEEADAMEIEKVKKGIEELPTGYQQIINLYLIEGYDHVEIGEILNISTSTSKSQYHRAKKKLLEIVTTI